MVTLFRACFYVCFSVCLLLVLSRDIISTANASVLINEFLPDPDDTGDKSEWIELYNSDGLAVDLIDYVLDDIEGGSRAYDLSAFKIEPYGYLVIDKEVSKISLNNDGDTVRLLLHGEVVDDISYVSVPESRSYGRTGDDMEWKIYEVPTKGGKNEVEESLSTPTPLRLSVHSRDIKLSEIMACPSTGNEEWIELVNSGPVVVSLEGWTFTDAQDGQKSVSGEILPGEYLMQRWSGHWLNNSGDQIRLLDAAESEIDSMSYDACTKGFSFVFHSDGWYQTLVSTPGEVNTFKDVLSPTPLFTIAPTKKVVEKKTVDEYDVSSELAMPTNVKKSYQTMKVEELTLSDTEVLLPVGSVAGILDKSQATATGSSEGVDVVSLEDDHYMTPLFLSGGFLFMVYGFIQIKRSWELDL